MIVGTAGQCWEGVPSMFALNRRGRWPQFPQRRRWRACFASLVVAAAISLVPSTGGSEAFGADANRLKIDVLSNRADLVSGGDALVEIDLPLNADPNKVRVDVDGHDVTSDFALRPNGRFMGLLTGLDEGDNVVTARGTGKLARITITNHPIGGPIFSGPQVQPWICETEEAGLGPAQDEQCNAPTKIEFFYRSTNPALAGFQPYDPQSPPSDVAQTTTDEGESVPFIVRVETGTINRGIYKTAVLHEPSEAMSPWNGSPTWNNKLYYMFGGGSNIGHEQGNALDVTGDATGLEDTEYALSRGWAVAASSMNVNGNNLNHVTAAETVMMVKEKVVERFGEIRYTVGRGGSGGAVQQHVITNAYPGLLDGIIPAASYADLLSAVNNEMVDCSLLERVYNQTSPHLWAVEHQRAAVNGMPSVSRCMAWVEGIGLDRYLVDPVLGCTMENFDLGHIAYNEPEWVYDPVENPEGTRCTMQDNQRAMYGARSPDVWGEIEQQIGRGFAPSPIDNVGVQYGVRAVESGLITVEQFVDVNEEIGSYDIDYNWQPQRKSADPQALEVAYQTGQANDGSHLARVPMIDVRGPGWANPHELHPVFRSYSMRDRLQASNGHHDNQIIWISDGQARAVEAFDVMDEWLTRIESDSSSDALEAKVRRHKPVAAVDACWIGGRKITDQATCRAAFPYFGDPRIAAGGPLADDVLKCQLKPLERDDYEITFTDEQWKRMRQTFPTGVCDYAKPGVGQQPTVPWLTFADGPGGQPLGPLPRSTPVAN